MARLSNIGKQFFDGNGDPLPGGKLYFYLTGTTTAATTYSDEDETIANANPVILDADGRMPDIFYTGQLKITLTDANDVVIETRDPVTAANLTLSLNDLTDVTITSPSDDEALIYDSSDSTWKNEPQSGGGGGDDWWLYEGSIRTAAASLVNVDTHYFFQEDDAYTITIAGPKSGNDNDRMMLTIVDTITNTTPKLTINNSGASEIGFLGYDAAQNGDNCCQSVAFIYRNSTWIPYKSHKFTVPV